MTKRQINYNVQFPRLRLKFFNLKIVWFLYLGSCIFGAGCTPTKQSLPPAVMTPQPSDEILAKDISFDLANGEIRYILPEPALVRIRIGMPEGGPLLRTLVDWERREAGLNIEKWDKKDAAGQVDFSHLDNLMLVLACQSPEGGRYMPSIKGFKRSPEFNVIFLDAEKTQEGFPIVLKSTPVRIILADQDKQWLTDAGFEVVVYVDQVFLIEGEKGISPFNYIINTEGFNEGYHSITINVASFSGEVGTKSIKFLIKKAE